MGWDGIGLDGIWVGWSIEQLTVQITVNSSCTSLVNHNFRIFLRRSCLADITWFACLETTALVISNYRIGNGMVLHPRYKYIFVTCILSRLSAWTIPLTLIPLRVGPKISLDRIIKEPFCCFFVGGIYLAKLNTEGWRPRCSATMLINSSTYHKKSS